MIFDESVFLWLWILGEMVKQFWVLILVTWLGIHSGSSELLCDMEFDSVFES